MRCSQIERRASDRRHAAATFPMHMRQILALIVCALLLEACVHKIDVQQGNYLDPVTVSKLKLDMTRSQVRFILGSPLLTDPFHPERWDYVYIDYKGGTLKQEKRLTLIFEGDNLKRALSNFPVPQLSSEPAKTAASTR